MSQHTIIQVPRPLHAQLKALAHARKTTMVEIIAEVVHRAIEAGEIEADTPGLSIGIVYDLDQAEEADQGPWAVIKTAEGEMPRMSGTEAETVARHLLLGEEDGIDASGGCGNRNGWWHTERRGTSIKLTGTNRGDSTVTVTMAPVVARGLAAQLRKVAPQLIESAHVE